MSNHEPLDVSEFVDEDIDTVYEVELVQPSEPKVQLEIAPQRNEKFCNLHYDEIDPKIKNFQGLIPMMRDPALLEKAIEDLRKEKIVREWEDKRKEQANRNRQANPAVKVTVDGDNGRPKLTTGSTSSYKYVNNTYPKTDDNGSQSKGHRANGTAFSEECVLLNPCKEERPFTQRSPNTEGSTLDGRKDTSKIFSGDLPGVSPRPGLRSASKLCAQCGGTGVNLSCSTCRFYRTQPKRNLAKELPERNSPPGKKGNRVKRARQGVHGGDSPVVELFSSEDEEVKVTQDTFADCQIASQRKVYGTRSKLSPSLEGIRIAYPSRDDPEAVEVASHDLHRLEPLEFLNDTVIDFYIKYIQRPEVLTLEHKTKFYFFNSFFYKKLSEVVGGQNKKTLADLTKLRKWTKGTNIFEKEYLFVPIHDKWHWSLAIVCHPGASVEDTGSQRAILHLDSMSPGHKSNNVFRLLRTYLIAEWEHQADRDGVRDSFEKLSNEDFSVKKIQVPQQENESDCGLFLLHYIERFLKEVPASFPLTDVDQAGLFGRHWFKPSQASDLRGEISRLLLDLFEKEASRTKESAETIERLSVQYQKPENHVQQVNHMDVEATQACCSSGQCLAAELVYEHNAQAPSTPYSDSSSSGSTPTDSRVECGEEHLGADVEMWACSQADCDGSRKLNQLPTLGSTADFGSCDYLAPRRSLSGGWMDCIGEAKMLHYSKSRDRDLREYDQSEIPVVVDFPMQ